MNPTRLPTLDELEKFFDERGMTMEAIFAHRDMHKELFQLWKDMGFYKKVVIRGVRATR